MQQITLPSCNGSHSQISRRGFFPTLLHHGCRWLDLQPNKHPFTCLRPSSWDWQADQQQQTNFLSPTVMQDNKGAWRLVAGQRARSLCRSDLDALVDVQATRRHHLLAKVCKLLTFHLFSSHRMGWKHKTDKLAVTCLRWRLTGTFNGAVHKRPHAAP